MTPTVHLNGTSRDELVEQLANVSLKLVEAIRAMCDAGPNGRDYYPQGPHALQKALDEHYVRIDVLTDLKTEIDAMAEKVADQGVTK